MTITRVITGDLAGARHRSRPGRTRRPASRPALALGAMLDDTVPRTGLPAAPAHAAPAPRGWRGWREWPGRATRLVRVHWVLAVLLGAGLALRAVVVAAYHPALLYIDTPKYLYNEYPGSDP